METTNIVFINFDHQALHQWSFYKEHIRRPNFERITNDGILFDQAYCAAPLCGPSRRSLLTGLYPHTHGQHHNETNPAYDHEVYLDTLSENGYDSYYFGKWHAGPGCALDHKCRGFSPEEYGNPYTSPEYSAYLNTRNLPQPEHLVKYCFEWAFKNEKAYFEGYEKYEQPCVGKIYCSRDPRGGSEAAAGITITPPDTHEAFFLANLACDKLEELYTQKSDKPFSIRVDFWGPHHPYFPTQEYYDLYKNVWFPLYASYDDNLEGKPEVYFTERNVPIGQNNRIVIPNAVEWDVYNELLRHCAAQITMMDAAAGHILDKLDELGMSENTLIIWTADHGDGLACHGGHFDKGSYLSQEVLRVPLAMRWPGRIEAGQTYHLPVCTVDVPVTILDSAGLSFRDPVHGMSLLPIAIQKMQRDPAFTVCETYGLGYGEYVDARAIMMDGYKYIATNDQLHELYDLKNDPFELKNLIRISEYKVILEKLRDNLAEWQMKTDDPVRIF